MSNNNIYFNADDAGISLGVNSAISQMMKYDTLYSVSIFPNEIYTKDAISLCKIYPQIKTGLHFNITIGKSIAGHAVLPLLTKSNNTFRYSFVGLCVAVLMRKKAILKEIEIELCAQIKYLKQTNLVIDHINSHRHIHMIPGIFNIVYKVANQYKIPNIRIINEKLFHTILISKNISFIWNGNIIKFIILKFFNIINSFSCDTSTNIYFFSILHSCSINSDILRKFFIPNGFEYAEIMIHPGNSALDLEDKTLKHEKNHLISKNRDIEANTVLSRFYAIKELIFLRLNFD